MTGSLGLADRGWLLLDSERTPMHVGGLVTFERPDGAGDDFVSKLVARLRAQRDIAAPWNWRLPRRLPAALAPGWVTETSVDLDYHLRHSALPHPGGERELGILISRLHSNALDLKRPPWEIHVIEGLSGGRFGVYMKIHHALIDGVSSMRLLLRMTSDEPGDDTVTAPWTVARDVGRKPSPGGLAGYLSGLAAGAVNQTLAGVRFANELVERPTMLLPSLAPHSVLESPMNQQRRIATQIVSLSAVRAASTAAGATVNDVVLHLCGGALRRFLEESGDLPEKSMIAAVPMSLRDADDDRVGTQITMLAMPLGTHIDDPRERLAHISAAGSIAKAAVRGLGPEAQLARLAVTAAPMAISQVVPWGSLVPQTFNLGMSNVPGPDHPVYLAGARMLALYPASLLMHGGALNITCVSYDGNLDFGFTGARDVLPHLQRLAVHLGDVASELAHDFPPA